jgi:hypothetical protein
MRALPVYVAEMNAAMSISALIRREANHRMSITSLSCEIAAVAAASQERSDYERKRINLFGYLLRLRQTRDHRIAARSCRHDRTSHKRLEEEPSCTHCVRMKRTRSAEAGHNPGPLYAFWRPCARRPARRRRREPRCAAPQLLRYLKLVRSLSFGLSALGPWNVSIATDAR